MQFQDFLNQAHEKPEPIETGIGNRNRGDPEVLEPIETGIGNRSRGAVTEHLEIPHGVNFSDVHSPVSGALNDRFTAEETSNAIHAATASPHASGSVHQKELTHYTTDSYGVNKLMIGLHHGSSDIVDMHKSHLNHARALDKAFDGVASKDSFTAYTGVKRPLWGHFNGTNKHVDLHFPSFTSASTLFSVARSFADGDSGRNSKPTKAQAAFHGIGDNDIQPNTNVVHVLKINAPKGTNAISLKDHSAHPSEEEVLFHRGHDLRIHASPMVHHGLGKTTFIWHADVIGHSPDILPRRLDESIDQLDEASGSINSIRCGIMNHDQHHSLLEHITGISSNHDQHDTHFTAPEFSDDDKDAILKYARSSIKLNSALWAAHHGIPQNNQETKDKIAALDKTFEKSSTKGSGVVYTGVRDSVFSKFQHDGRAVAHHPAYISTSTDPNVATNFAYTDDDHQRYKLTKEQQDNLVARHGVDADLFGKRIRHVLKITIPENSKAHSVQHISKAPHEHEVIIHRGHDLIIDPKPHSIHSEAFAGDPDKGRVIVWNATLAQHNPKPLTEEKKMKTLEQFLESNREILSNALVEEIHPDIISAAGGSYGRTRLNNVAAKARTLLKQGVETGLVDGKPKKGSSRAVLFAKDAMDVKIDRIHTKVPHVLKIAFHGQLDSHTTDNQGLLGESQNAHEDDASHHHSILRRVGHNEFHTNTETGFLLPLLDHHEDHHWISVGKVDPIGAGDFRNLTKTKEFPKGISHKEFYDSVNYHHRQSNGGVYIGVTSNERNEELFAHPLVERAINFSLDTGTHPGDFNKANLGIWRHPLTGEGHIVASDAGFSEHVARRYMKARENQSAKMRRNY
jgi:hypothetical protein